MMAVRATVCVCKRAMEGVLKSHMTINMTLLHKECTRLHTANLSTLTFTLQKRSCMYFYLVWGLCNQAA